MTAALVLFMLTIAAASTFTGKPATETISARIRRLPGSHEVEVLLERTGPDAGKGCVMFNVVITFNDGALQQTCSFFMNDGETEKTEYVPCPASIAFAEVKEVAGIDYCW